ncbi:hypothetical protein ACFQ9H_20435 [Streptomyces sp. NPDC056517]|uniref:hypothetical protein n=1 Tax=unclassified Streptomyces TaxID=2593676 RepID=UPI0036B90DC2
MAESSSYGRNPEYLPRFMNDPRDDDGRQVVKLDLVENRELAAATLSRFPAASGEVRHARDILDAGPHFWIHPLGGSVLIECLMDGQVTVVTIPSE